MIGTPRLGTRLRLMNPENILSILYKDKKEDGETRHSKWKKKDVQKKKKKRRGGYIHKYYLYTLLLEASIHHEDLVFI